MKDKIARILLEKVAVRLNTQEPYTYVSGIRSPIYCDNRVLMFYPEERETVINGFVEAVSQLDAEVIAGTASSAICWAAWIADKLKKPMVYIRKKSKGYGADKLIEGGSIKHRKTVVIEDMVSTGGSVLNAIEACRAAGGEVAGMAAIFTYELEKAQTKLHGVSQHYLTDFSTLTKVAGDEGFITTETRDLVQEWNKDPMGWGPRHGFEHGEKRN